MSQLEACARGVTNKQAGQTPVGRKDRLQRVSVACHAGYYGVCDAVQPHPRAVVLRRPRSRNCNVHLAASKDAATCCTGSSTNSGSSSRPCASGQARPGTPLQRRMQHLAPALKRKPNRLVRNYDANARADPAKDSVETGVVEDAEPLQPFEPASSSNVGSGSAAGGSSVASSSKAPAQGDAAFRAVHRSPPQQPAGDVEQQLDMPQPRNWMHVAGQEARKRNIGEQHDRGGGGASGSLRQSDGQAARQQQQQDHVSVDFKSVPQREPFGSQLQRPRRLEIGSLWGLLVLAIAYVHHSTAGFALPALLPAITADMSLTDGQGAALTAGYTMLYAVALIPVGLLADRVDRPRLLAAGLVMWSLLTVAAARTHTFGELLACRVLFAIAQATQNPICFSLIPELFPNARITAMSFYNAAIYLGRALSFAVAILAQSMGVTKPGVGGVDNMVVMVPLDKLDLSHVSILYTQGDMAAIVPIYDYKINMAAAGALDAAAGSNGEGWRSLMQWLGPPGLLIAVLCLLTVDEPRSERGFLPDPLQSSKFMAPTTRKFNRSSTDTFLARESGAASPKKVSQPQRKMAETVRQLKELMSSRAFQAVTLAAMLNDVGSWALISWHATFYARVYDLPAETYAPLLAVVVPLGGLVGGVGGGLMGDWLSRTGRRYWLTAGACMGAAPLLAASILVPDYRVSFAALLVGFALAEAWRAPAAIIVRDVSPPGMGSTAASVHLCIRNIIGGLGPIGVALLAEQTDLRRAMLLVPASLLLSGIGFFFTERVIASPGSGGLPPPQQNSNNNGGGGSGGGGATSSLMPPA